MTYALNAATLLLVQEHHLTLHSILVDIPHDAAAIVIYVLSAAVIGWVLKAGLKKPDPDDTPQG